MREKWFSPLVFVFFIFFKCSGVGSPEGGYSIFQIIYQNNWWGGKESVSGVGSDSEQTKIIKIEVPKLLKLFNVETMLDLPCGDFNWMKCIDLSILKSYVGGDIISDLIEKNNKLYKKNNVSFVVMNIITSSIPRVDLIMCRDLFVHMPFKDIKLALKNLKSSGSTFLLITTNPSRTTNIDTGVGGWRRLNFEVAPFCFPKPLYIINEGCTEREGQDSDKSLALWKLNDLPL